MIATNLTFICCVCKEKIVKKRPYILKGLDRIKAIFFAVTLHPLSFFANTPFKVSYFVVHPVGKCSQLSVELGVFSEEQKFFHRNNKKIINTRSSSRSRAGCREPILDSPQETETANNFSFNVEIFFSRIITVFLFVK